MFPMDELARGNDQIQVYLSFIQHRNSILYTFVVNSCQMTWTELILVSNHLCKVTSKFSCHFGTFELDEREAHTYETIPSHRTSSRSPNWRYILSASSHGIPSPTHVSKSRLLSLKTMSIESWILHTLCKKKHGTCVESWV